jgi:hypothetical protein
MATIFSNMIGGMDESNVLNARDWFREKANEVQKVDTAKVIKKNSINTEARVRLGHLYLFRYEPKLQLTLPYYDAFPIIFVIKKVQGGFLGLNMHYLPYSYRAKLMDALYDFAVGESDMKRLRITYNILNATTKLRYYKPCIKHYLNSNIRSRFLHVSPEEWDTAVFLPMYNFKKATIQQVHRDSVRMIRRSNLRAIKR